MCPTSKIPFLLKGGGDWGGEREREMEKAWFLWEGSKSPHQWYEHTVHEIHLVCSRQGEFSLSATIRVWSTEALGVCALWDKMMIGVCFLAWPSINLCGQGRPVYLWTGWPHTNHRTLGQHYHQTPSRYHHSQGMAAPLKLTPKHRNG